MEQPAAHERLDPGLLPTLARSFLAGDLSLDAVTARVSRTLGNSWKWLRPLAARYVSRYTGRTRPRHRDVVAFLLSDRGFQNACEKYALDLSISQTLAEPQRMQPAERAGPWDIPAIESAGALAAWLGLQPTELDWFADLKTLFSHFSLNRLSHYRYRLLAKQWASVRLIEAPKPRLKLLQRQILTGILDRIPPHPAAHGFVHERSIKTFAAPHAGQRVVLRMDLSDFFPSFSSARIQTFFRTAGYPESVADLLGGICTTATPRHLWSALANGADPVQLSQARSLYSRRHLPQGSPSSPALANICSYRLDCRLTGLAKAAGATYTRYADDLAFSGDENFQRCCTRFSTHVAAVLLEEGFTPHYRKTRIMRQSVRQQLAGLVVNRKVNLAGRDFDRLKAILTNCIRSGPHSQNREDRPNYRAHLEGCVAFAKSINPAKGARLRNLFEQIEWPAGCPPTPDLVP